MALAHPIDAIHTLVGTPIAGKRFEIVSLAERWRKRWLQVPLLEGPLSGMG
jgi:hypothetical protein